MQLECFYSGATDEVIENQIFIIGRDFDRFLWISYFKLKFLLIILPVWEASSRPLGCCAIFLPVYLNLNIGIHFSEEVHISSEGCLENLNI